MQLFLRFKGPATILVQSRAAAVTEVFRRGELSEFADTEPGAVPGIAGEHVLEEKGAKIVIGGMDSRGTSPRGAKALKVAIIGKDGKASFQDSDFKSFTKP